MPSRQPSLESQIVQQCYGTDRAKLMRLVKKLRQTPGNSELQQALDEAMQKSGDRVLRRRQQRPASRLDQTLPFYQHREELAEVISKQQVVIVCGETGSGKTTQLPQLCLDLGLADQGMIAHTQPRRIAAQTVSGRIAAELQSQLGEAVGYKIRFSDASKPTGYIKLMTDGILLAEIQNDRWLNRYSTIIIDEAHERSLNIDLLLGYLRQILPKRPDLKLIVTSATINPEHFSQYFDAAPIVNISGRTYPVEIRYRPVMQDDRERDRLQALVDAIDELMQVAVEDLLVFFASERQIREAAEKLSRRYARDYEVLPLYGRLSSVRQQKIFARHSKRRIVLATNVAETSITVPGIRYVIDTGLVRLSRYSWRSQIQRLPIEKTSQASANQRSGRCGRLAPGICIRLYDEEDFNNRPEFTEPEILRTNLASVILQTDLLKLGSIHRFNFIDPPDSRLIRDGYRLLFELHASDDDDNILDLGRQIASLPLDPRLAAMLIRAQQLDCLSETLIVVSALSIQDPRISQVENRAAAQEKYRPWQDAKSDFRFWINLWGELQQQKSDLSRNQFARWCAKHYLSYLRIREWQDIYRQLRQQLAKSGFRLNRDEVDADRLHRAIYAGIPSQIASLDGEKSYQATGNRQVAIFPGSDLARQTPKWIMAFSMIETSRLYAHGVARFNPQWAMQDAMHLHHYEYYEPHWQARQGRVAAYRNTRINGLLIEGGKRVNFAAIDPQESRKLFIQRALVEGDYRCGIEVINANRKLIDHYQKQEERHRRRDILVTDKQLFEFYDGKIPAQAVDAPSFEAWLRRQGAAQVEQLRLGDEDLIDRRVGDEDEADFPAEILLRNQSLRLDYQFDPASEFDGVTAGIPLALLNQFDDSDFDWLVPGMLKEKIESLIRSLPRKLRKNFIPVSEFSEACHARMNPDHNFYQELSGALLQMTGVKIAIDDWRQASIDRHLNFHFRLEQAGETIALSISLAELQQQFGDAANADFEAHVQQDESITRSGLVDWDFESWESPVSIVENGQAINAYPALVDYEETVAIELFETESDANFYHATGIARLIYLRLLPTVKTLGKNLPRIESIALMYSSMASRAEMVEDIILGGIFATFLADQLPGRAQEFNLCIERHRDRLVDTANRIAELSHQVLTLYREVKNRLEDSVLPAAHVNDMAQQCEHLVYPGFLRDTSFEQLLRTPAYFQAILRRLQNYKPESTRIDDSLNSVQTIWNRYLELCQDDKNNDRLLNDLRWMIEEFRIACFAQPMKTRLPVSEKKLYRLIDSIAEAGS